VIATSFFRVLESAVDMSYSCSSRVAVGVISVALVAIDLESFVYEALLCLLISVELVVVDNVKNVLLESVLDCISGTAAVG
jgi:hypothetical protein